MGRSPASVKASTLEAAAGLAFHPPHPRLASPNVMKAGRGRVDGAHRPDELEYCACDWPTLLFVDAREYRATQGAWRVSCKGARRASGAASRAQPEGSRDARSVEDLLRLSCVSRLSHVAQWPNWHCVFSHSNSQKASSGGTSPINWSFSQIRQFRKTVLGSARYFDIGSPNQL